MQHEKIQIGSLLLIHKEHPPNWEWKL